MEPKCSCVDCKKGYNMRKCKCKSKRCKAGHSPQDRSPQGRPPRNRPIHGRPSPKRHSRYKETIKKFDKDKDGKLNEEEREALEKYIQKRRS